MSQRNDEYQRYEFIYEMERLYLQEAFSDDAMGERLGTDRSNVWRIRRMMTEKMGIPIDPHPTERGKWYIHPDYSITHIPLSREQMAALYLAARRLQQQTRTSQQPVVDVLEKLAHALRQPLAEGLVKAAKQVLEQEQDPQQQRVFADLVQCWLNRTPARITHRKLHGEARVYRVYPYQIEPAVWGDGNYLIGFSEYHNKIATFKLSRIEKVVIGTGKFEMPAEFNVHDLLKYAWGVWHADEEPITVKLRFSKWAVPRLRESIWHPTAILHDPDSEGNCEWEVQVAEWREIFPWVKGWGSNVTVLEPSEMVEEMKREVRRLVRRYAITELPDPPPYQLLWAKTGSYDRTHPLICHLIDVGQAALALWHHNFSKRLQRQIANALGLGDDTAGAGRAVAFWASLHDLGKASPSFQRLYKPAVPILERAKFSFPPLIGKEDVWHATITTTTLAPWLEKVTGLDRDHAQQIAQALGGHHGNWPSSGDFERFCKPKMVGDDAWDTLRGALVTVLHELFAPPTIQRLGADQFEKNTFLTLFSAMTTVADWIGSMAEYFDYVDETPIDPSQYSQEAAQKALKALNALHWTDWQTPQTAASFQELFPYLRVNGPSAMQQQVIQLAQQLTEPALVIIEAPTGSGKTEAALYLADQWAYRCQQRGLYVAMPTMATSNQMFKRVCTFLEQRYPTLALTPLLIHSQARWMQEEPPPEIETAEETGDLESAQVPDTQDKTSENEAKDMTWFLPRKRSLLAPWGVGTVDQTLLGVLQTRHFFVRLLGLAHKTVIFDEVHAYDLYMSKLFQRLLSWLRAMNVSVVILSATLPAQKRRELLAAYAGKEATLPADVEYPALTWAIGSTCDGVSLPKPKDTQLALHWIDRTPAAIVEELRRKLSGGGCAAVICNTVARTQEVYQAICEANLVPCDYLFQFHARTCFGWRQVTEKIILNTFGPGEDKTQRNPQRPDAAIVVATQVIEQSLDLDFDLMISDLAPIDLLIQRAGRLHRHPQNQARRPAALKEPQLFIAVSETGEDLPDMSDEQHIYEPELLIRTFLTLDKRAELQLPKETADLIERVYGSYDLSTTASPTVLAALRKAQETRKKHDEKAEIAAKGKLVYAADDDDLLYQINHQLDDENPNLHATYQALTRLGPRSLSVVCLHEDEAGNLYTEAGESGQRVNLKERPDADLTMALALSTVNVTHYKVVEQLLKSEVPTGWRKHSLLRQHYVLRFRNNTTLLEGTPYQLTLDRVYGLKIENLSQAKQ